MSAAIEQRNQDATCYIGNLDEKVNEEILWELFLQAGPVVNVHMPKDKVRMRECYSICAYVSLFLYLYSLYCMGRCRLQACTRDMDSWSSVQRKTRSMLLRCALRSLLCVSFASVQ
jgi:hypothetical protein